jgi:hypothetical protein
MATEQNKQGLSRNIPEQIKREIRKAAGFGCVYCGNAIGIYEHIEPEFYEATQHDPERMAYLCAGCHDKVTRGIWSKSRIWEARAKPYCRLRGKPHEAFDVANSHVAVWLGANRISDIPEILRIADDTILRIDPPEEDCAPYRISGKFFDSADNLLFSIDQNEWVGEPIAWDIECQGPRIVVRSDHRVVALQICAVPPHGIVIERALFTHKGVQVIIDDVSLKVISQTGGVANVGGNSIAGTSKDARFLSVDMLGHFVLGPGFTMTSTMERPKVPPVRVTHVGRNDPCPCGSGRKSKKCCGSS